ncbi:class I SAM-dependent methyltransferase [Roseovarius sp. 10]|uniref:class I SAM-dependent methyltransferase n=1 Tax=Roseovarius sp. 10 TaxID=3080563 RepID=UPI002952FBAB|nr:class I SAM-dependent methyltransferase [Roseovarius sp. 10]MDV7199726.1 class I SAM-dependent methyltransferase [Roseovarius sp. 10]
MTIETQIAHSDDCPICSERMKQCFSAQVLRKYQANYEVCDRCGFLRARDPHWLNEAYTSAISSADTGLVMRNISIASKLSGVLYWLLRDRGAGVYLDAAGGYGVLTRLMRDFGFDFYWNDEFCENLMARGFEYNPEIGSCNAVTAVEVFEHLVDPVAFVREILSYSGAKTLIFTTELYSEGDPPAESWWYYTFATGQHIGFFQRRTMEALGERLGLKFASANGIHIFSEHQIDEARLGVVTGRLMTHIAPIWVRRRLGSKTFSDHLLMLEKMA